MQYVFKRYEKKYILNEEQYKAFMECTRDYIIPDKYGLHTICNIYYDTEDFLLIRRSIEKPVYKEKFRIRSYGIPDKDHTVFLELKKKYKDVVYKRRLAMPLWQAEDFLERNVRPEHEGQVMKEIDYFLDFYKPVKKMYIAYDRRAYYVEGEEGLRITIDRNIRSREDDLFMEYGDKGRKLLPDDVYLMEIKTVKAFPLWLVDILSKHKIYKTSFSKYGMIYTRMIKEKLDAREHRDEKEHLL